MVWCRRHKNKNVLTNPFPAWVNPAAGLSHCVWQRPCIWKMTRVNKQPHPKLSPIGRVRGFYGGGRRGNFYNRRSKTWLLEANIEVTGNTTVLWKSLSFFLLQSKTFWLAVPASALEDGHAFSKPTLLQIFLIILIFWGVSESAGKRLSQKNWTWTFFFLTI